MSRKAELKENSGSKSSGDSVKRQKMNENFNFSKTSEVDDNSDRDASVSVTIYEDESDIHYFTKSTRSRLLNPSQGKRSPLAMLNKATNSLTNHGAGPSTSSQSIKSPAVIDEAFIRRLQQKETLPDPFQKLSDEVVLHVLSFLPKKALNRIATVNERFSRIIQDESLWVRLDIGHKVIRTGAMETILCRGVIVLRLASAKLKIPVFEPNFTPSDYASKLQFLDLSMCNIDTTSLKKLLATCRHLNKLSLEFVPVDTLVCREIAQNRGMEVLNLAMCDGLTKEGVAVMMIALKKIEALNVSWTGMSAECVNQIAERISPTIRRLNFSGCRKSFQEKHLKMLSERCSELIELDLSDCTKLSSSCVQYFSNFSSLELLCLSRCYGITMTSYLTLNKVRSLKYLDIFGLLTGSGLEQLECSLPHVTFNKYHHSSVARPTIHPRRTSIWGIRTRD